jgi:HSP20 family molecular chaperone IbpA
MAKSFFQRLVNNEHEDEYQDDTESEAIYDDSISHKQDESNLHVDVYQTPESIVLKAFTPGVTPGSVELSLTRDMLNIRANREDDEGIPLESYSTRELDWKSLKRTVLLPSEVDIDLAEATESHGVLTIKMPKINKDRETKIRVKSR